VGGGVGAGRSLVAYAGVLWAGCLCRGK
jgi:hypothetical protein